MADGEVKVTEATTNEITRCTGHTVEKCNWVSFEEESEVPLLPQPPSRDVDMSSERYINRLEQKLRKIKDPSNITSKNVVSALTEAKENQMRDLMSETCGPTSTLSNQTVNDADWDDEIHDSTCCHVSCYSYLFPKKPRTAQEIECLLDEDELDILSGSQQLEETQRTISG